MNNNNKQEDGIQQALELLDEAKNLQLATNYLVIIQVTRAINVLSKHKEKEGLMFAYKTRAELRNTSKLSVSDYKKAFKLSEKFSEHWIVSAECAIAIAIETHKLGCQSKSKEWLNISLSYIEGKEEINKVSTIKEDIKNLLKLYD